MSKHQKRISSPQNYPVKRKDSAYVVKAQGPHSDGEGVPLAVVLRDLLGYADSMDEVKELLSGGKVLVNGRTVRNPRTNLGFMDVVTFPDIDEGYRVLIRKEGFHLKPVEGDEAGKKLARVEDKTTRKGGTTQLNLHGGDNIETDEGFDTGGSLLLELPELEVEDYIAFEEGNLAYVTGGRHAGETAEVVSVDAQPGSQDNTVTLESEDGEFQTVQGNVYMVGDGEPALEVGAGE